MPEILDRKNTTALLIADMHLRPLDVKNARIRERAIRDNERLAAFLASMEGRAQTIVLLGDTFHFWFERRSLVVGDYYTALSLFKAASERGMDIHHVRGNRDFAVGEGLGLDPGSRFPGFFRFRSGFTVSRLVDFGIEPHGPRYRLHTDGKSITCIHGDSFCTDQKVFKALRWLLTGPIGRTAMKYMPWSLATFLASSAQNAEPRSGHHNDPGSLLADAPIKREIAMGADLILCGHIHAAHERSLEAAGRHGRLIAIPTWQDGYYGLLANGEVEIHRFDHPT
ncbi:MAG: metallophosphoesterase [Planctomycetota bacterium]|jgi:UDP-2,3-diacylglucosamine pyrophosphatase LpxH|nr:metallophosphoesterase [Planctomycetota bacterium]